MWPCAGNIGRQRSGFGLSNNRERGDTHLSRLGRVHPINKSICGNTPFSRRESLIACSFGEIVSFWSKLQKVGEQRIRLTAGRLRAGGDANLGREGRI